MLLVKLACDRYNNKNDFNILQCFEKGLTVLLDIEMTCIKLHICNDIWVSKHGCSAEHNADTNE